MCIRDRLTTYIEKFQDIRVLVIGDIMLDRFMYGKVERISPEAPVPVFKFHHEKKMLGGADVYKRQAKDSTVFFGRLRLL